jgi:hypothetical protein
VPKKVANSLDWQGSNAAQADRLQAQALPFRWQLVGTSGLADVKPATWTAVNLALGVRDDWPATLPAAGHFSAFWRTSQRLNPADTKPFAPL